MAEYPGGLSTVEGSGGGLGMDEALKVANTGPRPPSSGPLFFGMASEQPASQHNNPSSSHPRIVLPPLPPPHPLLPDLFFTGPPPSAATSLAMNVDRPLNVTDALGYLDAVKNQFQEMPDVYNQFLDIMKDFKSQVIDTPGVIQRVSQLFHGNPALIQGFNTFLPQGYRIDISPDHDHTITVTTPTGTTTQSTGTNIILSRTPRAMPALAGPGLVYPGGPPILAGPARALTPHGYLSHDPATFSPGFQQQTTAASFLGNLNKSGAGGPALEAGPPSEFNHAIQYLNKIKARYADDQNTYKQFLDILQTYQREGKHSQDNQVYLQVQMLFKDAPDLILEFKNFLPEAVNGGAQQQDAAQMMANQIWSQQQQQAPPSPQPTKKVAPAKRKKRTDKEPTPVPAPKVAPGRQTKKVKHHHLPDTGTPAFGSPHIPPRSPPPQSHMYPPAAQQPPAHTAPADKLMFFDRAKRALESKEMYEEFLKLLSLFSKEIIDAQTLVERAKVFLGEETLLAEFKDLVGWDHQMENPLDYGPPGSIRMQAPDACAPQPVDDGEGPSYRRLPESEIRLACSGRDELCRSVLNDDWVSHPTWASEEAGFVAHKKNSFEEALHKSEEERHEYHVHLEALTRTIALLEPLNARIEEMNPEERATFRLKPDFGGSSKSLYHRTIKRIYGRDNSAEIILAMQEGPSVAVPVVLARLKHKDEDWRRAMREYSRTWREVDSKNFYKSLDHQGISFKANDKKNITSRCFVQDIETIQEQQVKDWEDENGGKGAATARSFAKRSIGHQLEYAFADTGVLLDSLKLVYSFLDRSQVQYSPQERRTVEKFLRSFIPRLCNLSEAEFNAACGPLEGGPSVHGGGGVGAGATTEEEAHEGQGTGDVPRSGRRSNGSATAQSNGHSNGVPASDLRKKLLKTAQEKASRKDAAATTTTTGGATTAGSNTRGSNSGVGSRAATPSPVTESTSRFAQVDEDGRVIPDLWIKEAPVASGSAEAGGGHDGSETADPVKPFFANTTFYTLLRLLQLLYSRLLMCKEIGADLAAKKHAPLLANQTALELGLVDPSGPSVVLQQSMEALGERPGNEPTPNVVYMYLLNACEKMFDSEMDLATFEEHTRWFFGTKAYHLFTLDKLIAALIKQVQIVLSDHKCQELWTLLQLVQGSEHVTKQDVVRYRRSAEKHIAENDHLYRIQWDREKKSIRVSLTSQDDATIETDGSSRRRWREYVNTYVMTYPTEWVPPAKPRISPVFLRRCAQGNEEGGTASTILRDDHTRIRISLPTYKLVYEGGCEDVLAELSADSLLLPCFSAPSLPSSTSSAASTPPFRPLLAVSCAVHAVSDPSTVVSVIGCGFAGAKTFLGVPVNPKALCIMAKPFSVAPSDGPADFNTTLPRHTRPEDQPYKRRRRRKGLAGPTRSLAPSATLLSLLSAIASSSVAEGSPAPPSFLCPSIQRAAPPTRRRVKRDNKSSASTSVPSVPRAVVRNIADKYEQGEDGLWRRVDSYTLYGVCPACSTSAVSAIDEQASRNPNGTTSTDSTSTSTSTNPIASMDTNYDAVPDKLPPGWEPKEPMWGHEGRTTLILAMSLVLAFLICFLIIACLFWRKSMRRKYKEERDVEMKGKGRRRSRQLGADESREAMLEKENKAKQKLWARATARWRANARISARQRRGKRSSQMSQAQQSSISLDNPRDGLTSGRSSPSPSGSSPPSRSVSRRGSSSSLRQESSAESSSAQQQQDTSTVPTISLSPPPPHSSPPAYQQKALQADSSSEGLFPNDNPASTSHLICSRRPSHASFLSNSEDSGDITSIPSAHVATDDKAVLARLADLASAPPGGEDEGLSYQPQVSAPEWRDEEMEDFMAREALQRESDDSPHQSTSTPSPFPPPPSKGSLLAPNFYDYPYAFEDMEIENLEPEFGPSAPPFEETPSAPLVDEHDLALVPSAPPMLDDDDFYVNESPVPSAPPHESSPSHSSTEGSDGDGASAGQVGTGDGTTSSGNVDGSVLPDYHP